jgi:septal ring factor EnvC (AmiA/AmiB activator)
MSRVYLHRLAVIALLALMPVSLFAQDKDLDEKIKGKEGELQKLREEINKERKNIREIEKKERNVADYIARLEKEGNLTGKLLSGLEEKEKLLEEQVEKLRGDLETSEMIYRHRLQVFSARLREMYKDGPRFVWQELLSASDFSDLLQRYKFISMIAENDAAMIADVRDRKETIERQEAELTELLYDVTVSRGEKETELENLKANEAKRRRNLADLQVSKEQSRKRAEELEESEKRLQNLIEGLEKARLEQAQEWGEYGEGDFLSLKGKMPRPVDGTISRGFGRFRHPEFGTVTFNTGVDISSRAGRPVRAVARGRIEYSGNLPGYGNCIILNHGGGYYTLYAHITKIKVSQGRQVERGQLLGEVGREGAGGGETMHFEIRKSKKALDPSEWFSR